MNTNSSRLANQYQIARALAITLLSGGAVVAQDRSPSQLRRFIDQQVGGIEKLMVPTDDSKLPQPLFADGKPDPRFKTTEAKRFLGKNAVLRPDPNDEDSAGLWRHPRHEADRHLRILPPR